MKVDEKPKAAALYVRISQDSAGEALGVQRQEAECRAWAKRMGWSVAEVYPDNDLSASKSHITRPHYERMMSDLKSGKRDAILAWDMDRLTRQLRQLADLIDLEVPIGTVSGSLDLSTDQGRLIAVIMGGVARHEVEHKSKRIAAQLKQKAYSGLPITRKRPFGWTDNTCMTLHPVEAPALQKAANDLLAGKGLRSITNEWNRQGLTTTQDGAWVPVTLRDLLLRYTSAGVAQYKGEPLWDVETKWVPILDRYTFDAVVARLKTEQRDTRAARKYMLSTVLECARCGRVMRGSSGRYKCTGELEGLCSLSILPKIVDAAVTAYVIDRLMWLSNVDLLGPERAARSATLRDALAALATERNEVAASGLDLKSRIALLRDVEARETALQVEANAMTTGNARASLIASLSPMKGTDGKLSFDRASENRAAITERWLELSLDQQRLIARSFGRYVVHPFGTKLEVSEVSPVGHGDRLEIERLSPDLVVIDL